MYSAAMADTVKTSLVPSPESVVGLIERIATSRWPDRDADQTSYLDRLGFAKNGERHIHPGDSYSMGPNHSGILNGGLVSTDLPAVNAFWSSYDGELFSINVFLYSAPTSPDSSAVLGYRRVYSQLVSLYGPPLDATSRTFDEATAFWKVEDTSIEMYCYTRDAPGVQLGFAHILRNAAYEANLAN
jgi:hypothetical protein